jgi:MFS family permease
MTLTLAQGGDPPASRPGRKSAGFYYGWVIVIVMAVTGGVSMALGGLNFGLFIKPIGDDLGIGRATFGWAQSARQVASALTAPVVGGLLDRFGARVMLAVAATLTGLAMAGFAFVMEGWEIIALFALTGVVGLNGPGALVTSVPVTRWFVRKRGKALAMTSLGIPLGGFLFVPLTQILIDFFGWRLACAILGIGGAAVIVPLSVIFLRRQPEDMGLLPDGAVRPASPPTTSPASPRRPVTNLSRPDPHDERSWTRAEAVRTSAFWRLIVVFSLVMLAVSSVGVHRIPSFMDRGLDARLISYGTALDAAAAGLSTFVLGMLTHRTPARYLGAGGFLVLAFASALSIVADTHSVMFVSMIVFGVGIGGMLLIQNYVWADYFGRRYQGSIRGAVTPITLASSAAGPPIAGYVRDLTGSYNPAWLVATGLMIGGAILLATTPPPRRPADAAPVTTTASA